MTPSLAAGLALALVSAAALNWSYFAQHGAAGAMPPLALRRPLRSLRFLLGSPRWVLGLLVGIGGWVLYVAALALAPLSLVQAASAGGIGLLALLASRLPGSRLARRDWLGVWIATGGLVLLALSLSGHQATGRHGSVLAIAGWLVVSAAAAAVVAGPGAAALAAGAGLGAGAGILYAAGDVGTKAAVAGGARLWFVPALLACHLVAFVTLQLAFQRGSALATAGVATLFTNALPIAAGTILFGEGVPPGLRGGVRVAAFAAVVAGATLLARPGTHEESGQNVDLLA